MEGSQDAGSIPAASTSIGRLRLLTQAAVLFVGQSYRELFILLASTVIKCSWFQVTIRFVILSRHNDPQKMMNCSRAIRNRYRGSLSVIMQITIKKKQQKRKAERSSPRHRPNDFCRTPNPAR